MLRHGGGWPPLTSAAVPVTLPSRVMVSSASAWLVPAAVEIREDIAAELPRFRAIREKHGMAVPDDDEHLRALTAEGRVLLAITPDEPSSGWTGWGLD